MNNRFSLAVPSVWVSAFRNDVLLRGPFPPKLLFDTWKIYSGVPSVNSSDAHPFNSTERNSFPSLYPSLLSLKEASITAIWGKNISCGEIWSVTSLCTVFKIRLLLVWHHFIFWWDFFCHVSFVVVRINIYIVNAMQPIFFPTLLWNLWNILKVGGGGRNVKEKPTAWTSQLTVCFICSMTCPSICLSSPHPSIQLCFSFLYKRTLNP